MKNSTLSKNKRQAVNAFMATTLLSLSAFMPVLAEDSRLTSKDAELNVVVDASKNSSESNETQTLSSEYKLPPLDPKFLKKEAKGVEFYQYDKTPLGDRKPLLMVHGLRGEFLPYFRWQHVIGHITKDSGIHSTYKVFLARYPTLTRVKTTVPAFRDQLTRLYNACGQKPITMVALSMGGNVAYEAMVVPEVSDKVKVLLAMGTMFHGSPLFSSDWMQYSIYKRLSWPWTRIDHSLALKLYFDRNENLLQDFAWDDIDGAVPIWAGKFKSRLLLGPKGELSSANSINTRLKELNETTTHVKNKVIAYGGYLLNPYLEPTALRYIENTATYPITFFTTKMPAHLAREHPALGLLNRDIAAVQINPDLKHSAKTPFFYALNDGITPISSALFLPEATMRSIYVVDEKNVAALIGKTDVKRARAFRNIDHLTFIDAKRPLGLSPKLKDELNPDAEEKHIFDWIRADLLHEGKEDGKDSQIVQKIVDAEDESTSPQAPINLVK
ncbi:MAG: hypothetical protein IPG59_07880 [Candidatus Melainabacteria bacterium]|nr:MAG: hypothetical protein IPG59_07880 [Candidatus Melainabacteria bacterium]